MLDKPDDFARIGRVLKPELAPSSGQIRATPFSWPDPAQLRPRAWLYGRHLIRRFVSATIAPGGVGKSSLLIVDALAMASGRNLLGAASAGPLNVWLWNGEDPGDEIERRVAAAALHYGITEADCAGRLYMDSGRDTPIVVARQSRDGAQIMTPVVDALKNAIRVRSIDVLIIDPFVSCHEAAENDNNAIDRVAKTWAQVAHDTGCAIELVHHSRKTGGHEVTIEDARGGSALISAVRSARVLNVMTKEEAEKSGVDNNRLYFSVDLGKANMAPPADHKFWMTLKSVELGNGDDVGVVTPWRWPDPLAGMSVADLIKAQQAVDQGRWRESNQAKNWVGIPIGEALGIDPSTPHGKTRLKGILAIWLQNGMFKTVQGQDEKRNERTFVEVGKWATE